MWKIDKEYQNDINKENETIFTKRKKKMRRCLEVLTQLTNAEIARSDVVTNLGPHSYV